MSKKCNIVSNVLSSLNHKIDKVFNERYKRNILNDDSYFTRKGRKTSFKDTMKTVISFGSDSLPIEMNEYYVKRKLVSNILALTIPILLPEMKENLIERYLNSQQALM